MAPIAPSGGDDAPGGVADADSRSGTDLIPAEQTARRAIERILGIESDVLRTDTPLASIGWTDEAWLCLAEQFDITDHDVASVETFGQFVACFGGARER